MAARIDKRAARTRRAGPGPDATCSVRFPSKSLLIEVSHDRASRCASKAAYLMGMHSNDDTQDRLVELLDDNDFAVQRAACEALVRAGQPAAGRQAGAAAGRARPPRGLGRRPRAADTMPQRAMAGSRARNPRRARFRQWFGRPAGQRCRRGRRSTRVLDRGGRLMKGLSERRRVPATVLRVIELALLNGEVAGRRRGRRCAAQLSEEYPSRDYRMNRELVRLLVYLQDPSFRRAPGRSARQRHAQRREDAAPDARPIPEGGLDHAA